MDFRSTLAQGKIMLFDGGMGSLLASKGLALSGPANLFTNPQAVMEAHREYVEAGADCIITNTFTLNELYMKKQIEEGFDIDEANKIGVRLAREAAGPSAFVFGDISSTGLMLKPLGPGEPEEFYQAYLRQAKALASEDIDGFIIETIFDLAEAMLALKACREVSQLPVIVSLTFSTVKRGGRTIMGNSAVDCAKAAKEAGACAVGANCGDLSPLEMAEIMAQMKSAGLPLIVQPNAGKPIYENGVTRYAMGPEEFAGGVMECIKAGAQLAGGCCGTRPEHISALKLLLQS